jgi:hypothetical protein
MGLLLIGLGLILWLAAGWFVVGLILIVVGILLLFAPWPGAYGYSYYRGRQGPPR